MNKNSNEYLRNIERKRKRKNGNQESIRVLRQIEKEISKSNAVVFMVYGLLFVFFLIWLLMIMLIGV